MKGKETLEDTEKRAVCISGRTWSHSLCKCHYLWQLYLSNREMFALSSLHDNECRERDGEGIVIERRKYRQMYGNLCVSRRRRRKKLRTNENFNTNLRNTLLGICATLYLLKFWECSCCYSEITHSLSSYLAILTWWMYMYSSSRTVLVKH